MASFEKLKSDLNSTFICSCGQRSQIKVKGHLRSTCKIIWKCKFGLICILEDQLELPKQVWGSRSDVNLHHPQTATAGNSATLAVRGPQSIIILSLSRGKQKSNLKDYRSEAIWTAQMFRTKREREQRDTKWELWSCGSVYNSYNSPFFVRVHYICNSQYLLYYFCILHLHIPISYLGSLLYFETIFVQYIYTAFQSSGYSTLYTHCMNRPYLQYVWCQLCSHIPGGITLTHNCYPPMCTHLQISP